MTGAPGRFGRAPWLATGVVALGALGLCLVPGFGRLGYYASVAVALAGSPVALLHGIASARRRRALGEPPGPVFVAVGAESLLPIGAAALILALNALRVPNCDLLEGAAFFLAGAACSLALAAQLGAAAGLLTRTRMRAAGLGLGLWLAALLRDLVRLYAEPPIFAFNPFVGFFSGAVYDAAIEVEGRYLAYRALNLVQWGLLWTGIAGAWDAEARRVRLRRLWAAPGRVRLLLATLLGLWGTLHGLRGPIGYEIDAGHIRDALGGRIEGGRIVLHYDTTTLDRSEARWLLEDHRYRLAMLDRLLGERYPHVIHAYVYGSAAQKRALMGGARVHVAKPWLRQIHVHHPSYGDSVVAHELAHVVMERDAPRPFGVPTRFGVVPHAALIEGVAEALEWGSDPLTLHQWSAAMHRAGIAPDLREILAPSGFLAQAQGKAYTLSGSFVRWLLDTRDAAAMRRLYASGDFEAAYGTSLEQLLEGWRSFLDEVALPEQAMALARAHFQVPGVFFRVCPLETARLARAAARHAEDGRLERALRLRRRVVAHVPDDPRKRIPVLGLLARMGRIEAFERERAELDRLLDRADADEGEAVGVLRSLADAIEAEARWRIGDLAAARRAFEAALDAPLDGDRRRVLLVKRDVVADPERARALSSYFLAESAAARRVALHALHRQRPGDPLVAYLVGRRRVLAEDTAGANELLEHALRAFELRNLEGLEGATVARLRREAWWLLGRGRCLAGRWDGADEALRRARALATWKGRRVRIEDWRTRCRWRRREGVASAAGTGGPGPPVPHVRVARLSSRPAPASGDRASPPPPRTGPPRAWGPSAPRCSATAPSTSR